MKRNIYQLLISRACSEFAASMYAVTLPLVVLEMTESLGTVSLFFALSKMPAVLLLPLLGIVVEKFNRQKLIISSYLISWLLFTVQFICYGTNAMNLGILTLMGIVLNISSSVADIATKVIFTEIVPKDALKSYNGTKSIVDNVAIFTAPMLGTFLYALWGMTFVLGVSLVFLGIASGGMIFLKYHPQLQRASKQAPIFAEMKAGLSFVKAHRKIFAFFILATALNFFVSPTEEVINPGILIQKYGISSQYFGFTSAVYIAGVILAGLFIVKFPQIDYQKHLAKLFISNSCIMILIGCASIVLVNVDKRVFFGIFLFLEMLLGFVTILINIPLTAYFQANVPLEMQGRFFAFFAFAANLSIPFGISFAGLLAQFCGADWTYIINNLGVILIVLFVYKKSDLLEKR